jgi:hypothetical protein
MASAIGITIIGEPQRSFSDDRAESNAHMGQGVHDNALLDFLIHDSD